MVTEKTNTISMLLKDVFFAPLRKIMEENVKTRKCKILEDFSFVALSVMRVLQSSSSGRDFVQSHGMPSIPGLNIANYFGSLASQRRLALITATDDAMTTLLNYDKAIVDFRWSYNLKQRKALRTPR